MTVASSPNVFIEKIRAATQKDIAKRLKGTSWETQVSGVLPAVLSQELAFIQSLEALQTRDGELMFSQEELNECLSFSIYSMLKNKAIKPGLLFNNLVTLLTNTYGLPDPAHTISDEASAKTVAGFHYRYLKLCVLEDSGALSATHQIHVLNIGNLANIQGIDARYQRLVELSGYDERELWTMCGVLSGYLKDYIRCSRLPSHHSKAYRTENLGVAKPLSIKAKTACRGVAGITIANRVMTDRGDWRLIEASEWFTVPEVCLNVTQSRHPVRQLTLADNSLQILIDQRHFKVDEAMSTDEALVLKFLTVKQDSDSLFNERFRLVATPVDAGEVNHNHLFTMIPEHIIQKEQSGKNRYYTFYIRDLQKEHDVACQVLTDKGYLPYSDNDGMINLIPKGEFRLDTTDKPTFHSEGHQAVDEVKQYQQYPQGFFTVKDAKGALKTIPKLPLDQLPPVETLDAAREDDTSARIATTFRNHSELGLRHWVEMTFRDEENATGTHSIHDYVINELINRARKARYPEATSGTDLHGPEAYYDPLGRVDGEFLLKCSGERPGRGLTNLNQRYMKQRLPSPWALLFGVKDLFALFDEKLIYQDTHRASIPKRWGYYDEEQQAFLRSQQRPVQEQSIPHVQSSVLSPK